MTYEENVRAILECNFAGFKKSIIDTACRNICRLWTHEECKTCKYAEHVGSIVAPVGTVKSVTVIENDGTRKRIPLDKVIIERIEDSYGL